MNISTFITELRNTDRYIQHIYTEGSCYKLYVLLSKMYKGTIPYISKNKNHIIIRYRNVYYDINGKVDNIDGYTKLKKEEIPMVDKWSFYNKNLLQISECPICDEPIVYKNK